MTLLKINPKRKLCVVRYRSLRGSIPRPEDSYRMSVLLSVIKGNNNPVHLELYVDKIKTNKQINKYS